MNLTQARAVEIPRPKPVRVGRGESSGLGKTSGKGSKGAKARSGYSRRPYFVGGQMPILRRIPKRGFSNPWGADYAVVNVSDLNRFADGETVDADRLVASGLVRRLGDGVKLLGGGALQRKLTVKVHRASASAKAAVEKAGGKLEAIEKVTARPPKAAPAPAAGAAPAKGAEPKAGEPKPGKKDKAEKKAEDKPAPKADDKPEKKA
jgi:large subunit ribosomal protein L15